MTNRKSDRRSILDSEAHASRSPTALNLACSLLKQVIAPGILIVLLGTRAPAQVNERSHGPLPDGDQGIAARYPGDIGIAKDPAIVFVEDFEEESSRENGHALG